MRWPWQPRVEERSDPLRSISDPALAEWFGIGTANYSGVTVGESGALGLSGFWRANALISGTIASLPLRTMEDDTDGVRQRVGSFLDQPGGPDGLGPTPFEWAETVVSHLVIHGNAFLAHVFNGAGSIVALVPIHPMAVAVEEAKDVIGGRVYKASLIDGTVRTFTMLDMTHIPALMLDGLRGMSLISMARNSLGTAIAGDIAAARHFSNGNLISGVVSPDDDVADFDAKAIKEELNAKVAGYDNAGDIAVINRKLKFTQWASTLADAQFLESRAFEVEEVARWTGVPPHLLMQTEKQTSWGTGVAEQNRGLARFTLMPWTTRIQQRLSRLVSRRRFAEFDYAGLLAPTPEEEIRLLIEQVDGGLITVNEARRIRNMDPVEGGDVLRTGNGGSQPPTTASSANRNESETELIG